MFDAKSLLKATEQSTDFVVQGIVRPALVELQRLEAENSRQQDQLDKLRKVFEGCYLQQDPTTRQASLALRTASFMDFQSLTQALENILGVRYNAPF